MISTRGRVARALAHRARGAEDRARLHLVDLGMDQPQPHAARAEHRVALRERPHALERVLERARSRARRVSRASVTCSTSSKRSGMNSCSGGSSSRIVIGSALHRLEDPLEVVLLERQQLVQRRAPAGLVVGHDHALHLRLAVGGHEHVLGAAQADALGAEGARAARVLGRVGVGAHAERAQLVAPAEQRVEARVDLGRDERDVVERDGAGRAVDRDQVALVQDALADAHLAGVQVDVQVAGAGDRRAAHAAGHERRVRGLAALGGEDALGGVEAGDVVGLGERPHEDDRATVLGRGDGVRRGEDDGALGRARRGGDAAGDDLVAARRGRRSGAAARAASARRSSRSPAAGVSRPSLDRVDREAHGGLRGALGVARLQHVQAPLLDRELGVLHVAVVALERAQDLEQLRVRPRASSRASSERSRGVRTPETTSSPWASIRKSPLGSGAPVTSSREKATPEPEVGPLLP